MEGNAGKGKSVEPVGPSIQQVLLFNREVYLHRDICTRSLTGRGLILQLAKGEAACRKFRKLEWATPNIRAQRSWKRFEAMKETCVG